MLRFATWSVLEIGLVCAFRPKFPAATSGLTQSLQTNPFVCKSQSRFFSTKAPHMSASLAKTPCLRPGSTLWFANERVRLYNVIIPSGHQTSWVAQHACVRWVVGNTVLTETRAENGGQSVARDLSLSDKHVRYYDAEPVNP